MAKKIICNLPNRADNPEPNCDGAVAHQISPRMLQIGRQSRQRISVVGSNWSALVTCPKCNREHSIVCVNGVIDEVPHHYEAIEVKPEGDPGDPNNPNNPGQHETKEVPPADPEPVPNPAEA